MAFHSGFMNTRFTALEIQCRETEQAKNIMTLVLINETAHMIKSDTQAVQQKSN